MYTFDFWWRMIRPHTLSASIIPVLIGNLYALYSQGSWHFSYFFAMLIASLAIQIATNLFNEYYDYVSGIDNKNSIGISGTIVRDGASPKFVFTTALFLYALSGIIGIWLAYHTSWMLLLAGGALMLIGFLYCGGPHPISQTPFGEIFAGGSMGAGIILIGFYIQTGFINWNAFLISLPTTILIAQILTANNLRDRINDKNHGRRTLAILLGHQNTILYMGFAYLVAFLLIPILVYALKLPIYCLLPLLAIPKARQSLRAYLRYPKGAGPKELMPGMILTAKTNVQFGALFSLALCLACLSHLWK